MWNQCGAKCRYRLIGLGIGCVSFPDAQTSPQPVDKREMVRDYPVDKIAAHTYVIHGPREIASVANQGFMNNPAFIITGEGVVVIEPGSSVQAGRMVIELKPPVNRDKGMVIGEAIRSAGCAWYFGDDVSDLKAFGALRQIAS